MISYDCVVIVCSSLWFVPPLSLGLVFSRMFTSYTLFFFFSPHPLDFPFKKKKNCGTFAGMRMGLAVLFKPAWKNGF